MDRRGRRLRASPRRRFFTEIDRQIGALALPALGSLAVDPIYSIIDTAFVGHLGAPELGAVALGSAAFTASSWLFSFLAYGVTPRVARAVGAGNEQLASRFATQALLLAVALGAAVAAIGVTLAAPIVSALGGEGRVYDLAVPYLRIRSLAAIPVLIATVGHGWLRGKQDTKTPTYIVVTAVAGNTVLDYLLIYVVGLGVTGAAISTVAGQVAAAIAFLTVIRRRMAPGHRLIGRPEAEIMKSLLRVGGHLIVRAGSLVGALTLATAAAARMGVIMLGAWQIAMQAYGLLALIIDSVAIAAQAMVGRYLGADSPDDAREITRRLIGWSLLVGLVLGIGLVLARRPAAALFTDEPRLIAATASLLLWLGLIQPLSAGAFILDGILIGASDTRVLAWSMAPSSAVFAAICITSVVAGWGLAGLAAGLTTWLILRVLTLGTRLIGGRWLLNP